MKISNYMNNTNSIMEKNTDKVQKGNSQTVVVKLFCNTCG